MLLFHTGETVSLAIIKARRTDSCRGIEILHYNPEVRGRSFGFVDHQNVGECKMLNTGVVAFYGEANI